MNKVCHENNKRTTTSLNALEGPLKHGAGPLSEDVVGPDHGHKLRLLQEEWAYIYHSDVRDCFPLSLDVAAQGRPRQAASQTDR